MVTLAGGYAIVRHVRVREYQIELLRISLSLVIARMSIVSLIYIAHKITRAPSARRTQVLVLGHSEFPPDFRSESIESSPLPPTVTFGTYRSTHTHTQHISTQSSNIQVHCPNLLRH